MERRFDMGVDLICPDCGGIIGGSGTDESGRGPCICYKGMIKPLDDGSDTVSIPASSVIDANDVETGEKICIMCGKNVAGHRRVKDSRGYLCYACAKAEIRQEKAGTIPCAECGRRVKEGGLLNYSGVKICRKCFQDHKEAQRKIPKRVGSTHYEDHEKRSLFIMLIIFVILGLIVLWRTFLN